MYFLHGILARAQNYVDSLKWPDSINRAISEGKLPEMIFVMPDAMTPYTGSMYSNSITTGDWEAFIASDLVKYIDSHYRTLAKARIPRAGRAFNGRIRNASHRHEASGNFLDAVCDELVLPGSARYRTGDANLEQLKSREDVEKLAPFSRLTLAAAAAWSPNATNPPLFMDLRPHRRASHSLMYWPGSRRMHPQRWFRNTPRN